MSFNSGTQGNLGATIIIGVETTLGDWTRKVIQRIGEEIGNLIGDL